MKMKFLHIALLVSLLEFSSMTSVFAAEDTKAHPVPLTESLSQVAERSRQEGLPILLVFSTLSCNYCERLEGEVIGPMHVVNAKSPAVIIAKIEAGRGHVLQDFTGKRISADSFADSYHVETFPTIALLSAEGDVLVPKIIGYQTPEFYSAYLDAAIEAAQKILAAGTTGN